MGPFSSTVVQIARARVAWTITVANRTCERPNNATVYPVVGFWLPVCSMLARRRMMAVTSTLGAFSKDWTITLPSDLRAPKYGTPLLIYLPRFV
jgi:hypothetical protein